MSGSRIILIGVLLLLWSSLVPAQTTDSVITEGATAPAKPPATLRPVQYPAAESHLLDALCGQWEIEASIWWDGPDRPPVKGHGYGLWHILYAGRYLEIEDSVLVDGRPLKIQGYMNWETAPPAVQLQLFSYAGVLTATGRADSAWHDLMFTGEDSGRPVRIVRHWINGNHFQWEVFTKTNRGREYKLIDADYLRSYGPSGKAAPAGK